MVRQDCQKISQILFWVQVVGLDGFYYGVYDRAGLGSVGCSAEQPVFPANDYRTNCIYDLVDADFTVLVDSISLHGYNAVRFVLRATVDLSAAFLRIKELLTGRAGFLPERMTALFTFTLTGFVLACE